MRKGALRLSALAATAALALAACGGGGGGGGGGGQASGEPQKGGTLKMIGDSDVDHLDTVSAYYTVTSVIERAYARRLIQYPATSDVDKAGEIVADAATKVPSKQNGGISQDGTTYTFHIKKGVKWDTDPARQVTAKDFARGLERHCNPVQPIPAPQYYRGTIVGYGDYCDKLEKVDPTAGAIKDFITSHDIKGVEVKDKRTLVINIKHPTPDFLNIMAMPFAAAAPKEYLKYKPDSAEFNQHIISNGPYSITTYKPNEKIILERNPAWEQKTDDLRHAYVDKVDISQGFEQQTVQQKIETGAADMEWDVPPPTSALPRLSSSDEFSDNLEIVPNGCTNPYLAINFVSPNENHATSKLKVRKALQYAVNKVAVGQVYGGPKFNNPASTVLPKTSDAYNKFDMYPTKNNTGNPKKAKKLLAEAGYPNGLTLKMVHRNGGNHPRVAQTIQSSLKRAGVTVKLQPVTQSDFYANYLEDAAKARKGVWDIAAPGWCPDWFGANARTYFSPLFDGSPYEKDSVSYGTDYGWYNNSKTNTLIHKALKAETEQQANQYWHKAAKQTMTDAAFVPIQFQKQPVFHSDRVHNFNGFPHYLGDITNIWLEQ